jgi:hypothetical protein
MKWLKNLFGGRSSKTQGTQYDEILPTGQRRADIIAMHERASKESPEERCTRLGVNLNPVDPIKIGPKWKGQHTTNCPVCLVQITAEISDDIEPEPYIYSDGCELLANSVCPFCKTRIAIILGHDDSITMQDKGWDGKVYDHGKKTDKLLAAIEGLEFDLDDTDDEKKQSTIEQKIAALKATLEEHEKAFAIMEDRYNDRCAVWAEKAASKYG